MESIDKKEIENLKKELKELSEFLEKSCEAVIEREEQLEQILKNLKKWDELSLIIQGLRVPVEELKNSTQTLCTKAETLVDKVELGAILEQAIQIQNQYLTEYLERANYQIKKVVEDVNEPLQEIIVSHSSLIQKFYSYLELNTQKGKKQDLIIRQQKIIIFTIVVGFVASVFIPLSILYTYPPTSPKHSQVLELLYERLFLNK
jgi:spore coat protein CotF